MSCKPIDQVTSGNILPPRQRIWKFIRGSKDSFTVHDILKATRVDHPQSRPYLKSLVLAGFIQIVKSPVQRGRAVLYKFVKGPMTAPRVRVDGSLVTQGSGQDNMWRTMKMAGQFTAAELAIASSTDDVAVSVTTAKDYIGMLTRAEYLRKIADNPARWTLPTYKRTGPLAPMIQRVKQVYDPNLNKVVWPRDEGDQS